MDTYTVFSVENLYWILYTHLLGPSGLDCLYYYPFGTTKYLSRAEFQIWRPRYEHHVLFHFDQEPLFNSSLGYHYDMLGWHTSNKIIKILANSEYSDIKREVCRERSMLDWYFFYHGLAAQDWFRDARYLEDTHEPEKIFCSYNHNVTGKRSYRMALTARLREAGVTGYGDISFHASTQTCQNEIDTQDTDLTPLDKKIIDRYMLNSQITFPMVLDHHSVNGSFSARFGHHEYRLWQNSLVHVVNETVFYDAKLHLTEKIFKPIVALRPFLLVAAPGNLAYLKQYGFKTFDTWIDESYDKILDNNARLAAITQEIIKLCNLSPNQLKDLYRDMLPILSHNKNHFFTAFRGHIIDELVDNFDSCIRIWNNGRVNPDRIITQNYDVELTKQILKQ